MGKPTELLEKLNICIYYGDCPFNFMDCQEDEPWFICPEYQPSVESKKYKNRTGRLQNIG